MYFSIQTVYDGLLFDDLDAENSEVEDERQKWIIMKLFLQYDSTLSTDWLNVKSLGTQFYEHLTNPTKPKTKSGRQKCFKVYKKVKNKSHRKSVEIMQINHKPITAMQKYSTFFFDFKVDNWVV